MNETKRLSVTMTRGERVLGWLYVPFFLVLLAWILAEGFRLLGWDTGTLLGQARLNGVFFGVNFLATVLIYRKFLSKSLAMVGRRFWGFLQAVILGLVMYYAGTLFITWAVRLWRPGLENVNDAAISAMAKEARWVMAAGTVKVTSGDTQIAAFKRQHMAPGEMEQIQLPKALLEKAHGTVTISVEEANA